MTTTAKPTTFHELFPRLIDEYALPHDELTPAHPWLTGRIVSRQHSPR